MEVSESNRTNSTHSIESAMEIGFDVHGTNIDVAALLVPLSN